MAVVSTPVGARARFTYMGNQPDFRLNGINPEATAMQLLSLVSAIQPLQTGQVSDAYLITENDLTEG